MKILVLSHMVPIHFISERSERLHIFIVNSEEKMKSLLNLLDAGGGYGTILLEKRRNNMKKLKTLLSCCLAAVLVVPCALAFAACKKTPKTPTEPKLTEEQCYDKFRVAAKKLVRMNDFTIETVKIESIDADATANSYKYTINKQRYLSAFVRPDGYFVVQKKEGAVIYCYENGDALDGTEKTKTESADFDEFLIELDLFITDQMIENNNAMPETAAKYKTLFDGVKEEYDNLKTIEIEFKESCAEIIMTFDSEGAISWEIYTISYDDNGITGYTKTFKEKDGQDIITTFYIECKITAGFDQELFDSCDLTGF